MFYVLEGMGADGMGAKGMVVIAVMQENSKKFPNIFVFLAKATKM